MIFRLFPRIAVKLDGERHVFDRASLMFTEVQEIEKATGMSYGEWDYQLGRHSITAIAALLHVLRKRDGMPSDFASLQFPAASLETVPLHDDDREYTDAEIAAEVDKRIREAAEGSDAGPTRAAAGQEAPSGAAGSTPRQPTRQLSPASSASGHGNGSGSRTPTGSPSRRTSTA